MLLHGSGDQASVHAHHRANHHSVLDQQKQGGTSIRKRPSSSPTVCAVCQGLLRAATAIATAGGDGGKQGFKLRIVRGATGTEKFHTVVRLRPELLKKGLNDVGTRPAPVLMDIDDCGWEWKGCEKGGGQACVAAKIDRRKLRTKQSLVGQSHLPVPDGRDKRFPLGHLACGLV